MKKKSFIFIISLLLISLILSFFLAIKYYKQSQELQRTVSELNVTISKIDSENDKLKNDNDFINKQYNDLKSQKPKDELINVEVQECMKGCNYTTACMSNCVYDSIDKWEEEIDKNIKQLEKIMTKKQIKLLHDSQKKWLIYKEAQQILNSETIGTMIGTMYTNVLSGEQVYIIELRAKELKELYSILSEQ